MDTYSKLSYLKKPSLCPYCKSDELDIIGTDSDDSVKEDTVSCLVCDKTWIDVYTLTDVRDDDQVMRIETRYVITNTQHLIIPAGYDSSEPVYEQTEVAIYCNEIPEIKHLPKCEKLWVHDIHTLTGRSK